MGDRMVGILVGVLGGAVPGIAMILIASAVTNDFEDQSGMAWGILGFVLILFGVILGGAVGAAAAPATRGQALAGVVLGALPGLAVWWMLGEINTVASVMLIVGPLALGMAGWKADHSDRSRPLAH